MSRLSAAASFVSLALLAFQVAQGDDQSAKVDFTTQIKPLLSDRCFLCHGPDEENRQADLRLDQADGLFGELDSDDSQQAVVAGNPGRSALIDRVLTDDSDLVMPPVDSGLTLSESEKQLLVQWVSEGAEWEQHWAFRPVEQPPVPDVNNAEWCSNEIDYFVMTRREAAKFPVTGMADREKLIRRVTFDLTGLPPTLEDIDKFLNDQSENAYETLVDRLLASEEFGERMASDWLDVARYSDTYGYQVDRDRFVWPWRDWVIRAFNDNKPHDQFIIEQLAGDLLDNASQDQILATTFNRLHPQKVEGGSTPEEFRVEYVADRTQTVGTAFMGLTLECARCHDHKYDPISQKEYYQLFSFFNNIDEAGLYSYFTSSVPTPTLRLTNDDQNNKVAAAKAAISEAESQFRSTVQQERQRILNDLQSGTLDSTQVDASKEIPGQLAHLDFETKDGIGANQLVDARGGKCVKLTGDHGIDVKVGNFKRSQPFTVSCWIHVPQSYERAVVFHRSRAWTDAASRGYELLIEDGKLSAALIHFWPGNAIRVLSRNTVPLNQWVHVSMTWDGSSRASGLELWVNGVQAETEVNRDNLYKNITGGGGDTINIGQRFRDTGFAGGLVDDFRVFDRQLTQLELQKLATSSSTEENDTSTSESIELLAAHLAAKSSKVAEVAKELQKKREALCALQDGLQEIMVMQELAKPRDAYLLVRGAYDNHGEPVTANVPASLPKMPEGEDRNRLAFARWLTSHDHPLTSRVAVNRFWQLCFGEGLVRTPEDFGSQGAAPTHPALLNYLAARFMSEGWDVKELLKLMVMSSTYRQTSGAGADVLRRDPEKHSAVAQPCLSIIR